MTNYGSRRFVNIFMFCASLLSVVVVLVPLFLVLFFIVSKGASSLNWSFFTELPRPVGEPGGGMGNGIVGTLSLIGLACLIGVPLGIFGGIYLSEFGKGRFALVVRFATDILNGTPSIVIGIFAYTLVVLPMGHFSALAGGVALGVLMIPTVIRTTEEMMKLVPNALREGALALGVSYSQTLIHVILKTARAGIVTGILLAVARIAGETAPLLFTALGNQFWSTSLREPIAALPLQIFTYAISPFEEWQKQAWAGALVLIGIVLLLNIGCRFAINNRNMKRR